MPIYTPNLYSGNQTDLDFGRKVAAGEVTGYSVVYKFGRNAAVGTTFSPICFSGQYRTPQVGSATLLRVKAGNTNDTATGTGARSVTIQGLNASGAEVSETLATAGTSASSNSSNSYIRLYRAFVASSGTYATQSGGSHSAAITIQNSAGTQDWLTIAATDFPKGQSEVGAYSVPLGYEAYVYNIRITVQSTKTADVVFFKRENILQTSVPYSAMRVQQRWVGITGSLPTQNLDFPLYYPALTDIGFMGKVNTGTGTICVDFDILLKSTS